MNAPIVPTNTQAFQPTDGGLRPSNVRWIVLGVAAFASASAYLTRHCISAANTTIQADLGLDDSDMGWIMGAFGLGYLFFQIPGGWLGNRFGTRFGFAFISTVWSLCNAWTAVVSVFWLLYASRFCLGVFQAGLTPISAKILKDWIPLAYRGKSSACIGASMSVGGAFTMWMTGVLLQNEYGWQGIFATYSLVGVAWAIGFYWFFRTYPQEHRSVNQAELALIHESELPRLPAPDTLEGNGPTGAESAATSDTTLHGRDLLLSMLVSRSLWGLFVQAFFRAAGYAFFVTFFFAFLEYRYGTNKQTAGFLTMLPLLAVVAGGLSGGVIVDLLLRSTGSKRISRSGTAFVALAVCGLFTLASAWTSSALELSAVFAIGALFSGIGGPASWAASIDLGGRHTALFKATMNMGGCLSTVIMPPILGNWFDHIESTRGDWTPVIYLHAIFYFAAAISWLVINPNDTPSQRKRIQ